MSATPRVTILESDTGDEWARVELYRWQHGHLPGQPGEKPKQLDIVAGVRGMADAIETGCRKGFTSHMPEPFNVVSVLRFVAKMLEESKRGGTQ